MTDVLLAPNLPKWMKDHVDRYLSSGGTDGHIYTVTPPGYSELHVPSLLLITKGRKSGQKYLFPLFYGQEGDSYFVIASKGGAPEHPAWYLNLAANPEVHDQVKADKFKAVAHTADATERAALWPKMVEIYGPYADYQKKTDRQIPVVVLTRA